MWRVVSDEGVSRLMDGQAVQLPVAQAPASY